MQFIESYITISFIKQTGKKKAPAVSYHKKPADLSTIVEKRLGKLLQKLSLPKPITVTDIKDIIWNEKKPNGSSQLFFMVSPYSKDQETVQEIMQVMQDA